MAALLELPVRARVWWVVAVCLGVACAVRSVATYGTQAEPWVLLAVAAGSAASYWITNLRAHNDQFSFDYSTLSVLPALFLAGPVVGIAAGIGRHGAMWHFRRPQWPKPVYNMAMTSAAALGAWEIFAALGGGPAGVIAGTAGQAMALLAALVLMLHLATQRPLRELALSVVRQNGWGDLQEGIYVVCMTLLWRQHPALAFLVPLAAYGQSRTLRAAVRAQVRAAQAEEASRIDGLTQVHNRRSLDGALGRGDSERGGVLMIDLDHFKSINDTYGHACGDQVLRAVAQAIHLAVRPGDFVARYGGEEFCVLLRETHTPDEVAEIGERIRRTVAGVRVPEVPALEVTASVGGAFWTKPSTAADGVRCADAAAYRAKHAGRNNVQVDGLSLN